MTRLNIFVDETGEFGFDKGASDLYGISFVFHEQNNDMSHKFSILNDRLCEIGHNYMLHMSDLVMHRGKYVGLNIKERKRIFNYFYIFMKQASIKFYSVFIDKKYTDNSSVLRKKIINEIGDMINKHRDYFKKFDNIVLYYDNGQEKLGNILDMLFSEFEGYEHRVEFDHKEKRLFQVADILTFIDKYDYKDKDDNYTISKRELDFFSKYEMRKKQKELNKKRF